MTTLTTALFIAYKSILKGSRSTTLLLMFILSLSFLNMMFISGILFGLQGLITKSVIDVWTSHVVVTPQEEPQIKEYIPNQDFVRAQIESIPGVIATDRRYALSGSVLFDKDKTGQYKIVSGVVSGTDPGEEKHALKVASKLMDGQFLEETDRDQLLLSSAVAGGYGVPAPADLGGAKVGDKVRITYSNGAMRTYTVKGIYDDSLGIFETLVTTKEAESVSSVYNSASKIVVRVDLGRAPLESYVAKIQALEPNLVVKGYTAVIGAFASFLDALNLISFIVSTISVLVAAITIFVIVYVNAINKRRQIGVLKAIGINERIIVLSYVFQSLFYSLCGIVLGSILVFAILTPILDRHPIDVAFGGLSLLNTTFGTVVSAFSLLAAGVLAGFIPARLVARENILKAIWG